MKTLLELCYAKTNLETNGEGVERDIYEKIVLGSREWIRKALRKQMSKLVLRTIYLFKTKNRWEVTQEIIGNFSNYRGSVWRISMIHAVASFIYSDSNQRIKDVMDTCEFYFPYEGADKEKREVVEKLALFQNEKNPDLFQYIDIYQSFGKWLLP